MSKVCRFVVAIMAATCLISHDALAHDIDLNVQVISPSVMQGALSFSDEGSALGQYIRIENLTDTRISELALQTDEDGRFIVAGIAGHRYRITAEGDEGHTVSVDVDLQLSAPHKSGTNWPPLYLMIGALLVLSLIPARWLRKK